MLHHYRLLKVDRAFMLLREVLMFRENKPEVVDREFWYKWALKWLGLSYKHETFEKRNAVEGFFSLLKNRIKRFQNRLPFNSSFDSVQSWLKCLVRLYNLGVLS